MTQSVKRTSLYEEHLKLNGKMVPFAGYEMPIQYTSVIEEHLACREQVALFDVSHMGEITIAGIGSTDFLNQLITNDVSALSFNESGGQALYAVMCDASGCAIDDVIVYRIADESYFICVNASNVEKDFAWMKQQQVALSFQGSIVNRSDQYSQIAVQGPKAALLLTKIGILNKDLKSFWFHDISASDLGGHLTSDGTPTAIIARTGYTGEDGFEVYLPHSNARALWQNLLSAGAEFGVKPAGLAARDTLRLEAKLPLYGQELTHETTPLEAKLGFFVKLGKPSGFIGASVLKHQKEHGTEKTLIGFELLEPGIPRSHYAIVDPETRKQIGEVTSGTFSPTLKKPIGLAYVSTPFAAIGSKIAVQIREKSVLACVVKTPFYKRIPKD